MATVFFSDPGDIVDNVENADAASVLVPMRALDEVLQRMAKNMHAGRLSISNTDPVAQSSSPVSTVYLMPYKGNISAQRNASGNWIPRVIPDAGISLNIGALSGSVIYDVFEYDNGGSIALETVAWASQSARATGLTFVDGIYVKSGAPTRKYRGTIRTTTVGTVVTYDSSTGPGTCLLFNAFNRVWRRLRFSEATASWSYTTGANRQSNGDINAIVNFVVGLAEEAVYASFHNSASGMSATVYTGIGYDSTAAMIALARTASEGSMATQYGLVPAIGYHYFSAMEYGAAGATFWGGSEHGLNVMLRM